MLAVALDAGAGGTGRRYCPIFDSNSSNHCFRALRLLSRLLNSCSTGEFALLPATLDSATIVHLLCVVENQGRNSLATFAALCTNRSHARQRSARLVGSARNSRT